MDHFLVYAMENVSRGGFEEFRHQKIYFGALESQFDPKGGLKMPISVSYEVNLTILCLYSLENSLYRPFFWSMS